MALKLDQITKLQGNAQFRKIAALEFIKAFQEISADIPVKTNDESVEAFNKRVDNYMNKIRVKGELERSIDSTGNLSIWATNHLLAALMTYDSLNFTGDTDDGLIEKVLKFEIDGKNIVSLECAKILKGYSYTPKKVTE